MTTGCVLRAASVADAAALAAVHGACFDKPWNTETLSGFLSRETCWGFVAHRKEAAKIDAFILLQGAGGESEILTLATMPGARRAGLARALLRAAAAEAVRRGARTLFLEVAEDNAAARGLYEGEGFFLTRRRRAYYARPRGPAADALVLSAELPLGAAP